MKNWFALKLIVLLAGAFTPALGSETDSLSTVSNKKFESLADSLFQYFEVQGTIVLKELNSDGQFVYNPSRAEQQYLPASTFKIPNSLIALEAGVIAGEEDEFKWDGTVHAVKGWNKDHNLRSAFKNSVVWYYKKLATSVGPDRYAKELKVLKYGNKTYGQWNNGFWLTNELKISANEQVAFLHDFYREVFPYKPEHYQVVKKIMKMEEGEGYVLSGKTGWGNVPNPDIGWFVGYLEKDNGEVWCFALNLDMVKAKDSHARFALTRTLLRELGLLR